MARGSRLSMAVAGVAMACASLAACGGDGSGGGGGKGGSGGAGGSGTGGSPAGAGGAGGATTLTCDEPATLDLTGTWVGAVRMRVQLDSLAGGAITICPASQVAEATLLMLFDVRQSGSDPTKIDSIGSVVCDITLPEVTAIVGTCTPESTALVKTQLVIPDALASLLPNIRIEPVTGMLSGAAPGSTLTPDRVLFIAGATGEPLPTWDTVTPACNDPTIGRTATCEPTCVSDCGALTDDDADGFPGITLGVCGRSQRDEDQGVVCNIDDPAQGGVTVQGKAWLDLKIDPLLAGNVESSCEVTGNVDATLLYNIVGADVFLGGGPVGVSTSIQSLPSFTVDPAHSPFRMVRVDGKNGAPDWALDLGDRSAACSKALARRGELL